MPSQYSSTARVKVILTYDELRAAKRAREAIEKVNGKLKDQVELVYFIWRFDVLQDRELIKTANIEATSSDMVVVAMWKNAELNNFIKEQIATWLSMKAEPDILLLAFLGGKTLDGIKNSLNYQSLKQIAHQSKVPFFYQPIGPFMS